LGASCSAGSSLSLGHSCIMPFAYQKDFLGTGWDVHGINLDNNSSASPLCLHRCSQLPNPSLVHQAESDCPSIPSFLLTDMAWYLYTHTSSLAASPLSFFSNSLLRNCKHRCRAVIPVAPLTWWLLTGKRGYPGTNCTWVRTCANRVCTIIINITFRVDLNDCFIAHVASFSLAILVVTCLLLGSPFPVVSVASCSPVPVVPCSPDPVVPWVARNSTTFSGAFGCRHASSRCLSRRRRHDSSSALGRNPPEPSVVVPSECSFCLLSPLASSLWVSSVSSCPWPSLVLVHSLTIQSAPKHHAWSCQCFPTRFGNVLGTANRGLGLSPTSRTSFFLNTLSTWASCLERSS